MSREIDKLELIYNQIETLLDSMSTSDKLLIASNIVFDSHDQLHKLDKLWKNISTDGLKNKEDYFELKDTYAFHEDSWLYKSLTSAHEILAVSNEIDKVDPYG